MAIGQFVVRSKLMPPQLGIHSIARPRLGLGVSTAQVKKVTLVSAPAGYGKTVLLGQWYSALLADGGKVAWVSLDEDDRDVMTFLAHITVSLSEAGMDLGPLAAAAHKGFPNINYRAAVNAIVNAAHDCRDQVFLILDDYHRAFSPDVSNAVETLIEHMPAGMHLFLSGRGHPGIRLTHLRMNGWLKEVLRADISFTPEEIAAYFNRYPSSNDVEKIYRRSEGWPIALNVMRMAAECKEIGERGGPQPLDDSTDIQDYWGEQVLSGVAPDYVKVLTDISILQRVNGDVINELCDRQDGWTLLENFNRKDLFVVSLDHEKKWYQFHQLFRDYLLKRLGREGATYVTDLHRRAALWFMTTNHVAEAFYHAGMLDNTDLVVTFIDRMGGFNACMRNGTLALRVVGKLSIEMVRSNARIWLAKVYSLLQSGKLSQGIADFEALRNATHNFSMEVNGQKDDTLAAEGYAMQVIIAAYAGEFTPPDQIRHKMDKFPKNSNGLDYMDGWFYEMLCWNSYVAGDFRDAVNAGLTALKVCAVQNPLFMLIFYNRICLALARLELGDVDRAVAEFKAVIQESEGMYGQHNNVTMMPKAALAQIYYYAGDLDQAENLLLDLGDYLFDGEVWYECYATLYAVALAIMPTRPSLSAIVERMECFVEGNDAAGFIWLSRFMLSCRLQQAVQQGKLRDVRFLLGDKFFQSIKNRTLTYKQCRWRVWNLALSSMIRAEWLLGNTTVAQTLLNQYAEDLCYRDHPVAQIDLYLLQAWLAEESGKGDVAANCLTQALAIPESSYFPQLFLNNAAHLTQTIADVMQDPALRMQESEREMLQRMQAMVPSVRHVYEQTLSSIARKTSPLSERETTVLQLMWNGLSSKEIGLHLELSESTVKIYRKRLYAKLKVNSRSEAIAAGRRLDILKDAQVITPVFQSRKMAVD